MPKFWKRRHDDPIEGLLREQRPEPREEFLVAVVARVESQGRRVAAGAGRARRQLAVAVAVTAIAVGAAISAGAVQATAHGLSGLKQVTIHTFSSSNQSNDPGNGNSGTSNVGNGNSGTGNVGNGNSCTGNVGNGNSGNCNVGNGNSGTGNVGNGNSGTGNVGNCNNPGDHQYTKTICHATHSQVVPYVELTLPAFVADFFVSHFPGDFFTNDGCPGPNLP
jgi:PPE-repeat protein